MVKIKSVNERVLVKKYVEVEVEGKEYVIYICNDIVRGIYEKISEYETVDTNHKALSKLTGMPVKKFMELVDYYTENCDEYEELEYEENYKITNLGSLDF